MADLVVISGVMLLVQGEEGGEDGGKDDRVEPGGVCLVLVTVVVGYYATPPLVASGPHEHAQLSTWLP